MADDRLAPSRPDTSRRARPSAASSVRWRSPTSASPPPLYGPVPGDEKHGFDPVSPVLKRSTFPRQRLRLGDVCPEGQLGTTIPEHPAECGGGRVGLPMSQMFAVLAPSTVIYRAGF